MYVEIKLIRIVGNLYTYEFICRLEIGLLTYNSKTNEFNLIKEMLGEDGKDNYFRAMMGIKRELKKGHVPINTHFASG